MHVLRCVIPHNSARHLRGCCGRARARRGRRRHDRSRGITGRGVCPAGELGVQCAERQAGVCIMRCATLHNSAPARSSWAGARAAHRSSGVPRGSARPRGTVSDAQRGASAHADAHTAAMPLISDSSDLQQVWYPPSHSLKPERSMPLKEGGVVSGYNGTLV